MMIDHEIRDIDGPGIPALGIKPKEKRGTCLYNKGVVCDDHRCDGCGWKMDLDG